MLVSKQRSQKVTLSCFQRTADKESVQAQEYWFPLCVIDMYILVQHL